jgi:hypothetical protein
VVPELDHQDTPDTGKIDRVVDSGLWHDVLR